MTCFLHVELHESLFNSIFLTRHHDVLYIIKIAVFLYVDIKVPIVQ